MPMKLYYVFSCLLLSFFVNGQNTTFSAYSDNYNYADHPVPDFIPSIFKEAKIVGENFKLSTIIREKPFASARIENRIYVIQNVIIDGPKDTTVSIILFMDLYEPDIIECMIIKRDIFYTTLASSTYELKCTPYDKCLGFKVASGLSKRPRTTDKELLPIPADPVKYFRGLGIDLLGD
jgi:hypothetical protein